MTLYLGIHTVFSSASAFSSLNTGIYTAAKPAKLINTLGVSPDSFSLRVYSMAGMIALGFLTDNMNFRTNMPHFNNGVSIQNAPSCLQGPTASSTPTGPAKENQRSAQLDRRRDPPPWPLPPPSRRPSGSQPPSRSPSSSGARRRRGNIHYNRRLRPFREDPPPPPPPSLAGFIHDFPKPQNFEEFVMMNILFGSICGWILRKLIGYYRGRKAPQARKTKILPSSLPKRATTSNTPKKTGDRSRPKYSRSRLTERLQTPFPLQPQRPSPPVPLLLVFTLVGSGSLIIFGCKARRRAIDGRHGPNQLIDPPVVDNRNSGFPYPVLYEYEPPADISYLNRLPRSPSTPPDNRREPSITRRSPNDRVRLSKTEHVRYFYKDEIIGFENGPRPRGRSSSVS